MNIDTLTWEENVDLNSLKLTDIFDAPQPLGFSKEPMFDGLESNVFPRGLASSDSTIWNAQEYIKPEMQKSSSDADLAQLDYVKHIWSPLNTVTTHTLTKTVSIGNLSEYTDDYMVHSEHNELRQSFKAMIDKIVKTNDQPASIYLQQRLKTETDAIKGIICDLMLAQIIPLIKNRFGNFLVQCLLENGSAQQIKMMGQKIRGHFYQLSCDRFGCHVMQKAIEKMDETTKLILIQELYKSIHETITHRFSCHVWQRIFEIKWTVETPDIMEHVHQAINGNWAEIANDENGSLVVQCIFEHCPLEDKLPIIADVFQCTLDIAKGKLG